MRGNGFGTKPGIKGVSRNGRGKFSGDRQRARSVHTTQHLPERKIERTQAALAEWRFTAALVMVMRVTFVDMRIVRVAARMPRRMHQRALLRNEQKDNAESVEKPARHHLPVFSPGKSQQDYLATVTTASVSR